MVKLVDTLASGASARKGVEVQVLSWAPSFITQVTYSADRRSDFGSKRGLFQLRARGACVIRLAAVRLETPDHPLLRTILYHSGNLLCGSQIGLRFEKRTIPAARQRRLRNPARRSAARP